MNYKSHQIGKKPLCTLNVSVLQKNSIDQNAANSIFASVVAINWYIKCY